MAVGVDAEFLGGRSVCDVGRFLACDAFQPEKLQPFFSVLSLGVCFWVCVGINVAARRAGGAYRIGFGGAAFCGLGSLCATFFAASFVCKYFLLRFFLRGVGMGIGGNIFRRVVARAVGGGGILRDNARVCAFVS